MTRERAIRQLLKIWVTIAVVSTSMITLQAILGKYGDDSQLAWNWILGQYTPSLSILMASVFSEASKRWRQAEVTAWKFRSARIISIFQFACIAMVLLLEPTISTSIFIIFEKTQVILSLVQALSVAALGALIFDGR